MRVCYDILPKELEKYTANKVFYSCCLHFYMKWNESKLYKQSMNKSQPYLRVKIIYKAGFNLILSEHCYLFRCII